MNCGFVHVKIPIQQVNYKPVNYKPVFTGLKPWFKVPPVTVRRYSAPVACLSPMMPSVSLSSSLGIPYGPSYVPSFWLRYADVMSFAERTYNAAIAVAETFLSNVALCGSEQEMLDDLYEYPGHERCPPLDELRGRVSLTLVNSHLSVSYARPYPPSAVSVAGMHMQPVSNGKIDPVRTCFFTIVAKRLKKKMNV